MILPDFVIPTRAGQCWQYSGMDSIEYCRDRKHFESFPYHVEYLYNSRGYRDQEWPESMTELQQSIWCLGDSFTVGIGSPREHTWSHMLLKATGQRTINVSMDGASNNWIARKAQQVIQHIQPRFMVIHWSYTSRREQDVEIVIEAAWKKFYDSVKDSSWPDCQYKDFDKLPIRIQKEITELHHWSLPVVTDEARILHHVRSTIEEDIDNTVTCVEKVNQVAKSTLVIHSFIPKFVPKRDSGVVESKIAGSVIPELKQLDWARDGHHYDTLTSNYFVDQIMRLLN